MIKSYVRWECDDICEKSRYVNKGRQTIQLTRPNAELKFLALFRVSREKVLDVS